MIGDNVVVMYAMWFFAGVAIGVIVGLILGAAVHLLGDAIYGDEEDEE